MTETYSLYTFWTAMLLCAGTVLTILWSGGEPSEVQVKIAVTFFVIGLASFLIWAPIMAYKFYTDIAGTR